MGLFDRFKKQQPSPDAIAAHIHRRKQEDPQYLNRNLVGDLVDYFSKNEAVTDAAFGFVPDKEGKYHLFLAVGLTGDEESVKRMTWMMKSVHIPQTSLNFASNLSDEGIYNFILGSSFAFYEKGKNTSLRQAILRRWFEPEKYHAQLVPKLKESSFFTLIRETDREANSVVFQTYERDKGQFIPLFSDYDMIRKCGLPEIPPGLTVIEFDYRKFDELLEGALRGQYFVLDPESPFEVEFYG